MEWLNLILNWLLVAIKWIAIIVFFLCAAVSACLTLFSEFVARDEKKIYKGKDNSWKFFRLQWCFLLRNYVKLTTIARNTKITV